MWNVKKLKDENEKSWCIRNISIIIFEVPPQYICYRTRSLWTSDHHTSMSLLDILFQNHGHYYGVAPFYNILHSNGKTFHKTLEGGCGNLYPFVRLGTDVGWEDLAHHWRSNSSYRCSVQIRARHSCSSTPNWSIHVFIDLGLFVTFTSSIFLGKLSARFWRGFVGICAQLDEKTMDEKTCLTISVPIHPKGVQ